MLDRETEALCDADHQLTAVEDQLESLTETLRSDQSYDELLDTYQKLESCRTTCENVLDNRQIHRTEGHAAVRHSDLTVDLQEYLYQPLDVTYPVIADASRLLDQLDTICQRIEDELMYRA